MLPVDFEARKVHRFRGPGADIEALVQACFGNARHGFFVDVGAHHPVNLSQTWHLEKLGWDGILIEPLPEYCEMLRSERRGRVVEVACSSRANHGTTMPLISASAGSTLNKAPVAKHAVVSGRVHVNVRTLDSVLEEYGAPTDFELLSVDVEGHEIELFDGFTFERWRPKLILLEDHVLDHRKHEHMKRSGYQLLARLDLDCFYVPSGQAFSRSLRARIEFMRKYWLSLPLRRFRYRKRHVELV